MLFISPHCTGLLWVHVDSPRSLPPPCQSQYWSAAPPGQVLWLLQQRSSRWLCWKSWRVSHCWYIWQYSFHILCAMYLYTVASIPNYHMSYYCIWLWQFHVEKESDKHFTPHTLRDYWALYLWTSILKCVLHKYIIFISNTRACSCTYVVDTNMPTLSCIWNSDVQPNTTAALMSVYHTYCCTSRVWGRKHKPIQLW